MSAPFALGTARRWLQRLLPLLALLSLTACKTAVYTHLTEAEANDALYTLLQGGLDAEKRVDPEAGHSIWTDKGDLARAIGLLKANAQPEAKHPTLGELFGRNQLISTPAEERVRFVYGTEQALAQTLSKIEGVLVARVHIVLPANDPLATELKPSSASIFIKHRSGEDLASSVPAIKDLVVRSIEGLSVDRVAVTLFPAGGPKGGTAIAGGVAGAATDLGGRFLGVAVPSGSVTGLWLRFAAVLLAAGAWVLLSRRSPAPPVRRGGGGGGAGERSNFGPDSLSGNASRLTGQASRREPRASQT